MATHIRQDAARPPPSQETLNEKLTELDSKDSASAGASARSAAASGGDGGTDGGAREVKVASQPEDILVFRRVVGEVDSRLE